MNLLPKSHTPPLPKNWFEISCKGLPVRLVESSSRASQVRSDVALEISVIQMVNTCNGRAQKQKFRQGKQKCGFNIHLDIQRETAYNGKAKQVNICLTVLLKSNTSFVWRLIFELILLLVSYLYFACSACTAIFIPPSKWWRTWPQHVW